MASHQHEAVLAALTAERAADGDTPMPARLFPRLAPDVNWTAVDAGGVAAEWVCVGARDLRRAILYLHGGGYTDGSPRTHRELVSRIARHAAAPVLSIDYRLAPAHPFPAALEDARTAWDWLIRQVPGAPVALVGDSAGGGLAIALTLSLRDDGQALPALCAAISPWCDLEVSGPSALADADPLIAPELLRERGRWYLGGADPRHPYASPVHARMDGLPPLFIQVGERELLLDDARRLAERALADGTPATLEVWPGMTHVWHIHGDGVPEARAATERLGAVIAEALRPVAVSA